METDGRIGGDYTLVTHRHPLVEKVSPYLRCLHGMTDPTAKRAVRWTPLASALAAVLMTVDIGCTLRVRCQDALACLATDFTRRKRVGKTYNGLMKALVRQAPAILPLLKADLRRQAWAVLEKVPRVKGWILLAVDGSKEELPRTASLESHFGIGDNGKCPQALLTSIVEVFTGLVLDWRIDPARGDEKRRLLEMIAGLPEESLLLADANYVGYPIWGALVEAGRHFLIRVGGNVNLIRNLWPGARVEHRRDAVYVWPGDRQKKVPPLRLRLIKVRGGKDPIYLLTNVWDRRRLSVRTAGKIYRRRWGIEVFHRTSKRTLGYVKLRSRSGRRAEVEAEWGMITLCISTMLGIQSLHRKKIDPSRLSHAGVLAALRSALLRGGQSPQARRSRDLDLALGRAVRDNYRRQSSKRSRHRPVTRNTPRPLRLKPPRIRNATPAERRLVLQAPWSHAA